MPARSYLIVHEPTRRSLCNLAGSASDVSDVRAGIDNLMCLAWPGLDWLGLRVSQSEKLDERRH